MRIVYNTDQIHRHGGLEKVMATKVNYLVAQPNIEVVIVTTEQKNLPPCYSLHSNVQLIDLGVNYERSKSFLSIRNICKSLSHFFKQRRLFRQLQPEVVVSPNYNFDHYWLPFILPRRTKLLKELHGSRFMEAIERQKTGYLNKVFWKLQDWVELKYDAIVVLNDEEASYRPGKNVVVLPNPVERNDNKASLISKSVIAAGRIAPVKGFDVLIKAWKIVSMSYPDWQLHIYGDNYGNTTENLHFLIDELQLSNSVKILPSVSNLPSTMLNYSMFVLSSETECFPTVLLEALSVGLPVVSYDCPNGPRYIINNQVDGLLVAPRNPENLASGIIALIQDEELRFKMGASAKTNSKKFETENTMLLWLDLFKKN